MNQPNSDQSTEKNTQSSQSRPSKIITIGSCSVDLVFSASKFPKPGETVMGTGFLQQFGGKGANQAIMASLLTDKSQFIGAIGSDSFGDAILENFEKFHVRHQCKLFSGSSGVAMVAVTQDGENSIIVAPGANFKLDPDFLSKRLKIQSWLSQKPSLCMFQNEIPLQSNLAAMTLIKKHGHTIIYNPAPITQSDKLSQLLSLSDWVILNETEIQTALHQEQCSATIDPDNKQSIQNTLIKFLEKFNCHNVLLTLGANGVYFARRALSENSGIDQNIDFIPATTVDSIIDTTGAGDAFCGAFASGLILFQHSPIKAIRYANFIAGQTIRYLGAQSGYVYASEQSSKFISSEDQQTP